MDVHRVEAAVVVPWTPARVYAHLTDWALCPAWLHGVQSAELVEPGPTRPGTRVLVARKILGRLVQSELEVTECEPGRRLWTRLQGGHRGECRVELAREGTGTRVALELLVDHEGHSRFTFPLLIAALRHQVHADLEALRKYAASNPGGKPGATAG